MQREILFEALKMNIARKRRKRWYNVLSAMAAVVVFATTYAMILPVITMENEYVCGLNEHAHSDSCWYTPVIDTDCSLECDLQVHSHEAQCYFEDRLVCRYADFVVHQHESVCFDKNGALLCALDEHRAHEHGESCYAEETLYNCGLEQSEGHSHSDVCYLQPQLICQLSETEGHSHGAGCYEAAPMLCQMQETEEHSHGAELVCGLEEAPAHSHSDVCYSPPQLICQLSETEGHGHSDACYSQPQLICQLSETEGHGHGAGCYEAVPMPGQMQETEEHSHGAECYGAAELVCGLEEAPAHSHDDSCMGGAELCCGLNEQPAHQHDESCGLQIKRQLICVLEEIRLHTHEQECFDANENLICTELQVLEHRHGDECFSVHTHSESCWQGTEEAEPLLCCNYHVHSESCLNEQGKLMCAEPSLICGVTEHSHSDSCRPQEENDTAELSFTVPAEYAAYIQSDVQFPCVCTIPKGSSLAESAVLPQISIVSAEGSEALFAETYHWLAPDGLPADENAAIDEAISFTLKLYPAQEADKAKLVGISFVYNDEILLSRSVQPGTVVSTLLNHDLQVKLDEIKTDTYRFEGWYRRNSEGAALPLEYGVSTAEEDTVYTAQFREYVPVTFHDIDPDGNEYEHSPVEYYIPSGESISQQQNLKLTEGSSIADCKWYKADGEAFDADSPVAEPIELYTYTYRLSLELGSNDESEPAEEERNEAPAFAVFNLRAAPAAQDSSGDESVDINKREGEFLSEEDFLVDGVDYTDYLWTDPNGNEINADSLVGTSLTSNYAIALAAAQSYTIKYNINVSQTNVFGTRPTVGNATSITDNYSSDEGDYTLRIPNPTRYMVESGNKKTLYQFTGWKISRNNNIVAAGETVDATWIKNNTDRRNGSSITLTAQWTAVTTKETVHFFVNLNCQVSDMDGVTEIPSSGDFTPSVFSSTMTVTGSSMQNYWRGAITGGSQYVVMRATNANDTANIDQAIRNLVSGHDSTYDTYNGVSVWKNGYVGTKLFQVSDFPSDEHVLSVVRDMINNGTVIRMNGVPIKAEDLTPDNFTVRWNVCKWDTGDGWHIDGLLVGKQAHLTVKKIFMGDDTAIENIKNSNYYLSVINTSNQAAYPVQLSLKSAAQETLAGYMGYSSYDVSTDTYTWVLPLVQGNVYSLRENNHISTDPAIHSSASYTISNSPDAFAGWNLYPNAGINGIKAYSYANDTVVSAYQTVELRNSYVKADTLTINKIDKDTGNGLPGISYRISDAAGNDVTLYKKAGASYYSMKAEDLANGFELCPESVITTGSNGSIFLKLDSGTFTLREAFPAGYGGVSAITVTVGADSYGNVVFEEVQSTDSTIQVEGVLVDASTASLTVRNVSYPTAITAKKIWANAEDTKEVTVALYRNGVALGPEYQAVLNNGNNWSYTWDDLPLYADGKAADYSLREIKIGSTNYDPTADVDGYNDYIVSYDNIVYYKGDKQVEGAAWKDDSGVMQYAEEALLVVRNEVYRGQLMFMKVDEDGKALSGAVFKLYSDQYCTKQVAEATSDSNGRVVFENLMPNTYYAVKESGTPDGYIEDNTQYKVRLTAQGSTILENSATGEQISQIVNYSDKINVKLHKISQLGNDLANAEFSLYQNDGTQWQLIGSYTTGGDGLIDLGTLSRGSYRLVEEKAPDGYMKLDNTIDFEILKAKVNLLTTGDWYLEEDNVGDTHICVVNKTGYELPQTGGKGWRTGYIASALCFAGAGSMLVCKRYRRRGAEQSF